MSGFRVTKYNPKLRLPDGSYSQQEWTSISDIGRPLAGRIVELSSYLATEDAYVESVRRFAGAVGIRTLRVADLQIYDCIDTFPEALAAETRAYLDVIGDGVEISDNTLEGAIRLALREVIWCRLEGDKGFYVHFGYDYYMYIGFDVADVKVPLLPSGMYSEPFASPYQRV